MKKILLTFFCALLGVGISLAKETTFSGFNTLSWTGLSCSSEDVTLTLVKGGSTAPATTYDPIRLYADNLVQFSVPEGYNMTKVVLTTGASSKAATITVNTNGWSVNSTSLAAGTNQVATFTGTGNSLEFTFSAQVRVSSFVVTYEQASDPTKKDAGLSFPQAEYNATIGEAFTKPELTKATTAAVEYASSNEKVATVDAATGDVTLVHWGETTITATAPAEGDFNAGSASYTLKVTDPNANDGTAEKPFTVAEAIEMCASAPLDVYVKGVITEVTSYNTTYKSLTYNIGETADATTTLMVYSGKNINGADFTGTDDIEVGASVVIKGNLKDFNGTPEFDKNNELVSYVAPIHPLGENITYTYGDQNGTLVAEGTIKVLKGMTITFSCENATKMTYRASATSQSVSENGSSIEYLVDNGGPKFTVIAEGVDANGAATSKSITFALEPEVLAVGPVSATLPDGNAIEANGSYTITEGQAITVSAENAVKYQISYDGQAAADMEGNSYTFNAVGENISVVFYAIGSDTSQKEIAFTLTVAAKPVEDVLNVDAFDITTTYKTYTYNSTASKVEYAAYAYNSSGMQINSKKGSSGIVSTANPESRAIKQIVITVYGGAGTLIVKAGNEANSLTGTGADAAINLAENATELTAAVDGKVYTYTPSNCTFFAVTSSGVVQITSINVIYGEPNSGTVTGIEGVEVMDANAPVEYYNLQGVRVAEPTPGLYIRRQGGKISKVIVK